MKKFLSLLIAVIIGLFSTAAMKAETATVNHIDTPAETKVIEWETGYNKRCDKYSRRNVVVRHNHRMARYMLLPMMLFMGIATAEAEAKEVKPKPLGRMNLKELTRELNRLVDEREKMAAKLKEPKKSSKYREVISMIQNVLDKMEKEQVKEDALAMMALGCKPKDAKEAVYEKYMAMKASALALKKESEAWEEKEIAWVLYKAQGDKVALENYNESKAMYDAEKKLRLSAEKAEKAARARVSALGRLGNAAVKATVRVTESQIQRRFRMAKAITKGIRILETIEERVRKESFQIYSWNHEQFVETLGLGEAIKRLNAYVGGKNDTESEKLYDDAKKALEELKAYLAAKKAVVLDIKEAKPTRIQANLLSLGMRIDTESKQTQLEWINIEHGLHDAIHPHWKLFSSNKEEGQQLAKEFSESMMMILENINVRIGSDIVKYDALYSSASHQKKEKLVLCKRELMEVHERLVWFGKTKKQIQATDITGAEFWKMRANLARPIAFALKTADGKFVYLHDIHVVPDVKKNYHHVRGLKIGCSAKDENGNPIKYKDTDGNDVMYEFGELDNPTICGDGQAIAFVKLNTLACQGGGYGDKLMMHYKGNADEYAAKKNGLDKIELPEGKLIVMGEGCWKFDKIGYANYDEFAKAIDELAIKYPGINQVYALRQSEEMEEEEKIRRISRSFLQQLPTATESQFHKLAKNTINSLKHMKTFGGLFMSLAELNKPEEKLSGFAKMIFACPALLSNPIIQMIGQKKYSAIRNDAAGCKLKTKGQYPYIIQDPVALIEIWLLGKDPDDPNLGVLPEGYASLVGVEEGKEVVGLRYPANAFTAKILISKPLTEIFAGCGNVAVLSIHDDILIVQDGDVDGDEMGIFYDENLVIMVKKMRSTLKPSVIVFMHGSKAERKTIGTEAELNRRMFSALWSAKEYDSVGKYANLARDCAYLISIELALFYKSQKANDKALMQEHFELLKKYMLWMAAASTGAILAIDQVKGNAIDPELIEWLDEISREVGKKMSIYDEDHNRTRCQPYTQQFVKDDASIKCLEPNLLVCTDELCHHVLEETGGWAFDKEGFVDNNELLKAAILDKRFKRTKIRTNPLATGLLAELRYNYFNTPRKDKNGVVIDGDKKLHDAIKAGACVHPMDILRMYWRNMCTLEFRMQAKTTEGKRSEYYKMVHDSVMHMVLDYEWVQGPSKNGGQLNYEIGHVFTKEEKIAALVNEMMVDALELNGKDNGIDLLNKGSYAKFVLNVFADVILQNIERNDVDVRMFMDENAQNIQAVVEDEEDDYADMADVMDDENDEQNVYNDDQPFDPSDVDYSVLDDMIPPDEDDSGVWW